MPSAKAHKRRRHVASRQLHGVCYFAGISWPTALKWRAGKPVSTEIARRIVLSLPMVGVELPAVEGGA